MVENRSVGMEIPEVCPQFPSEPRCEFKVVGGDGVAVLTFVVVFLFVICLFGVLHVGSKKKSVTVKSTARDQTNGGHSQTHRQRTNQ